LALIAYKQPVTRGDIEQVRGVSVSQNIMRTLLERDWIRVVGQREAPGRPSMYGTTKAFLDYFDLAKLEDLPPLEEIKAMIEPALVAEGGASVDGAGDANEDQSPSEPTDPAHEPDLSAAPEAEQPTHS
jgi:segregation and condensation protein B